MRPDFSAADSFVIKSAAVAYCRGNNKEDRTIMTEATSAVYVKKAAVVQTIAHINVKCDDAVGVLGVSAAASVRVSETLNGEVRLSGRESVELTVTTEDGMRKASGWAEISDRAEIAGITPQTRAMAACRVTDTDIVSVNGGNIALASVVEVTIFAEEHSVIPSAPQTEENIYADSETVHLSKLSARLAGRTESMESEKIQMAEVLCCNAGVDMGAPEATLDSVFAGGRFILDGVGKTVEGNVVPFTCELPFSCELPAEGVRRGDTVFMRIGAVSVSESRSESGVTLSASAELSGEVYCEMTAVAVTDAFSPASELKLTRGELCGMIVSGSYCLTDKAESTVSLPEGENADKITSLCGFGLTALSAYADGGKVILEGAVSGYVIYSDAEAGRRSSCNAEIPFRITTDISAEDNEQPIVDASVCSVMARSARRGEIAVSCTMNFRVLCTTEVCVQPVTGIARGEGKADRTGVLSMYSASAGETLWTCAKALSVSPDTLLSQNPDLEFPLTRREKVFVFRSGRAG